MNSPIKTCATLVLGGLMLSLVACKDRDNNKKGDIKTFETERAKSAINNYQETGSNDSKAHVEKAFADLDQEIRELEIRVQATTGEKRAEAQYKLDALKKRASELRTDYNETKFNLLIDDIKKTVF
ncbi:MAG: hypothetical protein V4507_15560 [Verrucomicrobiota bacterium]